MSRHDLREFSEDGDWDADDLAELADRARKTERECRDTLYGSPSGTVMAAPIDPPLHGSQRPSEVDRDR